MAPPSSAWCVSFLFSILLLLGLCCFPYAVYFVVDFTSVGFIPVWFVFLSCAVYVILDFIPVCFIHVCFFSWCLHGVFYSMEEKWN